MKALVTGGAGLIGSHIADLLTENGWDVAVLDNFENLSGEAHGRGSLYVTDVRDRADVRLAMNGVDVVFHQAAFGGFTSDLRKYVDVNVNGTLNVMSCARDAGVKKVVLASSQAVYGNRRFLPLTPKRAKIGMWGYGAYNNDPVDEEARLDPATPYALSKYHAERIALTLGERWGIPVAALRYALTYGPRQSLTNPYTGICSIFATRIRRHLRIPIYEDGMQTRDFTYVNDVARANLLAAENNEAVGVFNVGTGRATSVLSFVRALAVAMNAEAKVSLTGMYRPDDARHMVTEPGKLMRLGWQPTTSLEEGLLEYVEWLDSQEVPDSLLDDAIAGLKKEGIVK